MPEFKEVFNDPKFQRLPLGEQVKVMNHLDPKFSKLPMGEKQKAIEVLRNKYNPKIEEVTQTALRYPSTLEGAEGWANAITSAIGFPLSGILGLTTLVASGGNWDEAQKVIDAIQKHIIYEPKTEGGQNIARAGGVGMEAMGAVGGKAGSATLDVTGSPGLAAAVDTAIQGLPVIVGGKQMMMRKGQLRQAAKKKQQAVNYGIQKGVRPSIVKKETFRQIGQMEGRWNLAVDEIVGNKQNLRLTDREGNVVSGKLPESLIEFDQAIDQTKRRLFDEYNTLAQQTGIPVSAAEAIKALDTVVNSDRVKLMSPETAQLARRKMAELNRRKTYTATEVQDIIQDANNSTYEYQASPNPSTRGRAYIDNLIANNLRAALDATVEQATGQAYAPLKRKYGALRGLETEVTKRAIVDGRKNIRGLIDFTDVYSGSEVIRGVVMQNPGLVGAGVAARAIASATKWYNDPNRIVKSMFRKVEKLQKPPRKGVKKTAYGTLGARREEENRR